MSNEIPQTSLNPNINANQIHIASVKILTPCFDKNFYISIIINESKPQNTKLIEFKDTFTFEINQTFTIDASITNIEVIHFHMYEKVQIFSNALYKGEITRNTQLKDNNINSYVCFLKDSKGIDFATVYYSLHLINDNIFSPTANKQSSVNNINLTSSWINNIGSKNSKTHNVIYNDCLNNLDYLRWLIIQIENIIKWKDYWKSISYFFILSFIILHFKAFFVFIFPPLLMLSHMYYSKQPEKVLIIKNSSNKKSNDKILYGLLNVYNQLIKIYEIALQRCLTGNKSFIYAIYINICKLIIFNIVICYTCVSKLFNIKAMILSFIWYIAIIHNPHLFSFYLFSKKLCNKKLEFIVKNTSFHIVIINLKHFILLCIPFYSLYILAKEQYYNENVNVLQPALSFENLTSETTTISKSNEKQLPNQTKTENVIKSVVNRRDSKLGMGNTNTVSIKRLLTYEIYENERWWLFTGWCKDVIMDEIQIWYRIDEPDKYCDKNKVELPSEKNYKWIGEWKVEKTNRTDADGWEYANDFKSEFGPINNANKYVRRRKWMRFAN